MVYKARLPEHVGPRPLNLRMTAYQAKHAETGGGFGTLETLIRATEHETRQEELCSKLKRETKTLDTLRAEASCRSIRRSKSTC